MGSIGVFLNHPGAFGSGKSKREIIELQLPSFFNNFDPRAAAANFPSSVQAYLAGLTFALVASPCSTPVSATLLGYRAESKGIYGYPIEIQALFLFALRKTDQQVTNSVIDPDANNGQEPDLELGSTKDLLRKGIELVSGVSRKRPKASNRRRARQTEPELVEVNAPVEEDDHMDVNNDYVDDDIGVEDDNVDNDIGVETNLMEDNIGVDDDNTKPIPGALEDPSLLISFHNHIATAIWKKKTHVTCVRERDSLLPNDACYCCTLLEYYT
ncbi:hypothetical protein LOK49_LG01G00074 [Camellia lanceoleosa]|uniref:Uncharacterized protein n=1 Tax=Camellia lanceoleosa TaxID=1840588 RepID=A0ACC0J1Z5_9ERIC|nr:hypothetical protein LOK49_LG01G00074 [Camellia lanceoleosa]